MSVCHCRVWSLKIIKKITTYYYLFSIAGSRPMTPWQAIQHNTDKKTCIQYLLLRRLKHNITPPLKKRRLIKMPLDKTAWISILSLLHESTKKNTVYELQHRMMEHYCMPTALTHYTKHCKSDKHKLRIRHYSCNINAKSCRQKYRDTKKTRGNNNTPNKSAESGDHIAKPVQL